MGISDPYLGRINQLRKRLEMAAFSGAVISSPENIYYLSGIEIHSPDTLLVISTQEEALIGITVEIDNPSGIQVIYAGSSPQNNMGKSKSTLAMGVQHAIEQTKLIGCDIGIEETHLPYSLAKILETVSRFAGDVSSLLADLRIIKDREEIAKLRFSQSINVLAFEETRYCLRPGMREIELYQNIYQKICEQLGAAFRWNGCIGSGLRSALANPQPDRTIIQPGDLVLIDIFCNFNHYFSDSTRTFVAGLPGKQQVEIHKVLEEALESGVAKLKAGTCACDVDAAVRGIIERHGFGPNFPHHTGHGLGLVQQEHPWIIPEDHSEIQAGTIIALEPGIYLPGFGGMRLENVYLVTDQAPINLTDYPNELIVT
jgi:Xaa-Pro aminopeptidase